MSVGPEAPSGSAESLGSVRGEIAVYGLSTALGQGIALIAVPLYARWLGPSEYGLVELLTVVTSLIITGCGDAVSSAVQKLWFDAPGPEARQRVVPTGVAVGAVAALVASALVMMVAVGGGVDGLGAVAVAVATAVLTVVARVSAEQFRVSRRPWPYLVAMLARSFGGAAVALLAVALVSATAASVFIGLALGSGMSVVVTSVLGRSTPVRPLADVDLVRRLASISAQLAPAVLAGWSMMLIDRFVVAHYEPLSEVGIYGLANRISSVLLLVVYAFTAGWTPFALGRLADSDVDEARDRPMVLRYTSASVAFVGLLLSVVAPTVVDSVVGFEYADAADLVPILAFAFVLLSSVSITQVPLLAAGRVRGMAAASAAAAGTNLLAALVLVPPYGLAGAATATVVGFGTQAGLYLWLCQRTRAVTGMVSSALRVWLVAGTTLAAVGWLRSVELRGWALAVPAGFPVLAVGLQVLRPSDLRALIPPWRAPDRSAESH